MRFRQATNDDFDAVMSIIEDGRAALLHLGLDQWQGGQPNAQTIKGDIEAKRTMVAEKDGIVAGCIAFCVGEDPNYENITWGSWLSDQAGSSRQANSYVALHRIAVSAQAARQGIASFMIESSFQLARELGLTSARADTHEGNIPMQHTFEKCGMAHCCNVDIIMDEPTKKRLGYEIMLG